MKSLLMTLILSAITTLPAQAMPIESCPQATRDIYTDVTNAINAPHGFYDQLGDERAETIGNMVTTILQNSNSCEAAKNSLKFIDDNFTTLFDVK